MKATKILLALGTLLVVAKPASAARIEDLKLTLSDSRPGQTATQQFTMLAPSATAIKGFTLTYCTRASTDTAGQPGCTTPEGISAGTPSIGTEGNWTAAMQDTETWTPAYAAGAFTLEVDAPYDPGGTRQTIVFEAGGIVNPKIVVDDDTKACVYPNTYTEGTTMSATCFIRVTSHADNAGDLGATIDSGVVSYTIVNAVQVTATVDPTFTFTVTGVNSGQAVDGFTTNVSSTATALSFGNIQAGTTYYAAQTLAVRTNTVAGYTVTARMPTVLTGTIGTNNIDPLPNGAASANIWTAGGWNTWQNPNGTAASVDTAWFGAHIEDTVTGGGPSGATAWAGLDVNTAYAVKDHNTSDNGSVGSLVVYALEANVYQPADTYTGTIVYNALPKY